jgi:uncharacterized protein (TIGR00299 family) protein
MGKTLYLECESGISGDMTVAALLDLGADQQVLKKALASLPVQGFDIRISRVKKSGLDACDFDVVLDTEHENHDHDMEYLHGHAHAHNHDTHNHDADAHSMHTHHAHEHRSFADILQIIESSSLTERAKKTSVDIFSVLADAEAKAHGVPKDQVYFHEVGAVDSIVDILSVAICLDNLDIDRVIVTELCEGRGTVRCQHGILPIPVPAVANIVQTNHLRLKLTQVEGELVTPTGAAIVAAVRTSDKLPESFFIEKTGLGAGKREYACAGILRAMILESENEESWVEKDEICKLETNIDDCNGEALGFLMERLMQAGARDVHYTPVYMKKNRPAYQVNVICKKEDAAKLEKLIFQGTTTIGIRRIYMERSILKREAAEIDTPFGKMKVKVCDLPDGKRIYPEYEEVARICRETGLSYYEVTDKIQRNI